MGQHAEIYYSVVSFSGFGWGAIMVAGGEAGAARPRGKRTRGMAVSVERTPAECVSICAAMRMPVSDIAAGMGLTVRALRSRFGRELAHGPALMTGQVEAALRSRAADGAKGAIHELAGLEQRARRAAARGR